MNAWLVKWPNGDRSVVVADDVEDALFHLDEEGGATAEMLTEIHHPFAVEVVEVEADDGDGEGPYKRLDVTGWSSFCDDLTEMGAHPKRKCVEGEN